MDLLEFALDPRDQATYGGPEWVPLDPEQLNDLPFSVSGPWDRELIKDTGHGISELVVRGLDGATADGKRALVWLARKMAGIDTVPFARFDIRWRRVRMRPVEVADADPPSNGSSEPSSAAETSAQA